MPVSERALELAMTAAQAAADKKAQDIVVIDVGDQLYITDAFVIASASNDRQVVAIVDAVEEALLNLPEKAKPVRREGERQGRWVLLDYVDIVIHNYRWRLGLAQGEPKFDPLEKRLAEFPNITVPTITLQGDADGAPRPDPSVYAKKFSGKYEHRPVTGGIGHNLPQEAPQAFAQAIIDVAQA